MINYREADWGEALDGKDFDIVVDCVGGLVEWQRAQRILSPSGTFVTVAGDSTDALTISGVAGMIFKGLYRKS
eukprot:Awhi_evm1s11442